MRLIVARCEVRYSGRLHAVLPEALRLLMIKSDDAPDAPADWTSPEGELQAGIVFASATYVRKRARAGFERAKARAIEAGIPVATRAAVGYRKGPDRRLEPDPQTAPVVGEVFRRRARGTGPADLAALLQAHGVTTSQGSATWSKQAVYGLLASRIYLGELSYGKPPRYVNATAHEPLIDAATWQAAQHPNGRQLASLRSGESTYLLAGIVRCSKCRYAMQGTVTSRGKRIYRCTRRHAGGTCPAPARVNADAIEAVVIVAFWSVTEELAMQGSDDGAAGQRIADLRIAFERAERAHRQWRDDADAADDDPEDYKARLRVLRKRRDDAADALGRAEATLRPSANLPPVEDLRAAWEHMTTADRRALLGLRFDCIAVARDDSGVHVVHYPAGTGPTDLPRRGFTTAPVLRGFDAPPDGARVLPL